MFVSDAITSEIIYINDTACSLIHRNKSDCIGARCYQVFWDRCHKCDRCGAIDDANSEFYEEAILLKDGVTSIQLKAKLDNWDHRKVKVHLLSVIKNDKKGLK